MNTQHGLFVFLPLLLTLFVGFALPSIVALHRSDFPDSFIFGTASSAYQYEGAAAEGGRGASIWDTFAHKHPGFVEKIQDRSNGDVALDSYHRYKEDVDTMKDLGMDAYRFSVSWSRILPNGSLSGGINKAGVEYYNNLINYIISRGMKPFLTLFHWDTPQALEDAYGGFLSEKIVNDFKDYADVCFREFGDRVKHWITFNEPCTFSGLGYASGGHAPGRCSISASGRCPSGDSGREPYMVSHNILLAHGATSKLFRKKYKDSQKGSVGITLDSNWLLPLSNAKSDIDATQRALDFKFGWFMDPLTEGDYPFIMKALVGDRLPKFTLEQSELVKGSLDFLGINYYTSYYVIHDGLSAKMDTSYFYDSWSSTTGIRNGEPIGPQAASPWLYVYPEGLKELLLHAKNKYSNPIIYVTENGVDEANNDTISLQEALQDNMRVEYYRSHILHVRQAMREGADVRGYFAWSLYANFEWADGYTVRFGLHYVDYKKGLKRYPKKSAFWFQKFLECRDCDRNAHWSPRKL